MSGIKSQMVVGQAVIRGRTFDVERIAWKYTDGLSFDVHDVETGLCLTAESYDDWPSSEEIEDLLDQLAEDLREQTLDSFFAGRESVLARVVGAEPA